MSENAVIINVNQDEFKEKVIDASSSKLILVDFWAPWCGPCKQLTPLLEKIIKKANGKVTLVKVNIDENQEIAGQMRIQSIPAVFAFKDGKPSDAFQGVIPENKIIEFIEKSLGEKIKKDHTEFYKSIEQLISNNNFEKAIDLVEGFLSENPEEHMAHAKYIDCLSSLNMEDQLKSYIESLDDEVLKEDCVQSSIKKNEMKNKSSQGPSLEELKNKLEKKPHDFNILEDLVDKYFLENNQDIAFELLLNNFTRNKDKVKSKMIKLFEVLGNDNEKTKEYRKKLSTIYFT